MKCCSHGATIWIKQTGRFTLSVKFTLLFSSFPWCVYFGLPIFFDECRDWLSPLMSNWFPISLLSKNRWRFQVKMTTILALHNDWFLYGKCRNNVVSSLYAFFIAREIKISKPVQRFIGCQWCCFCCQRFSPAASRSHRCCASWCSYTVQANVRRRPRPKL